VEILVGEKRRERLHIGECRGTRKLVIPCLGVFDTTVTKVGNSRPEEVFLISITGKKSVVMLPVIILSYMSMHSVLLLLFNNR
jgi:hypothetical protein